MALTIINGLRDVGKLGSEYYSENLQNFIFTLKAGNTAIERGTLPFLKFMEDRTKTVNRIPGQPIPVERFNVFFTKGSYTDNGYGFSKYVDKFIMPTDEGLTAIAYNYTTKEILEARARGIDLVETMTEQLEAYMNLYQNNVQPYKKILTMLTGSSLTTSIPTEATDKTDDNYCRAFGWLRGEDISDFKKGHIQKTHECHYRGTKGKSFALSDIDDAVDTIKSYKDSSSMKPFALANSRTIRDTIATSLEWAGNRDEVLVEGSTLKYREAMGCRWIDMDTYLPEGIILFIDAQAGDLIIKAISPDEEQRGIAFIKNFAGEMNKLESAEDLAGGSVQVFPEEQIIAKRHLGLILDTKNQGKTDEGKEGWADEATVKKIEDFAKNLVNSYTQEMK